MQMRLPGFQGGGGAGGGGREAEESSLGLTFFRCQNPRL